MRHSSVLLSLAAGLVLASCGGGGDGGGGAVGSTSPVFTGVLVDSPVQGLPYSTSPSGLSGRTGPNGEFQYRSGDDVLFTMGTGGPVLRAPGRPVITPFPLSGSNSITSAEQPGPVNVARYLMTLDSTPGVDVLTMPNVLPTLPSNTCFVCGNFESFMANAGFPLTTSEASAKAHLKSQFAIWGSWATASSPNEMRIFTFLSDGTFLLANDDNPIIAGGNDGMEKGTYRWNPATNELVFQVTVNTDGIGGLSNLSSAQTPPYSFTIDGSGNSAVLRLGPNPGDEIPLTRVQDGVAPLVGGWTLSDPVIPGFYFVITFLADGTYVLVSDTIGGAPAGMERGTYQFDAGTGTLTITTTVDSNGLFGFNEGAALPANSNGQIQLASSFGSLDRLAFLDPGGNVHFDRVRVP